MSFKVGATVDGYEFLRLLGSSGSAVVFEVLNQDANRREMLKLLPRELLSNDEDVERFARETKVRSQLNHPRIAEFYGTVVLDGQPAMTMEMVDGSSLEEILAEGPITMGEAVDIAIAVLEALEYAHGMEVVHREVSPSNIYISQDHGIKLTGFGLAKQYSDPRLTAPGMLIGQVHYLSPEQVKGTTEIDGRSDIYSLAVVLFEALTGLRPFDSKSQFDIIQAHVLEAPPLPSDLREDIPGELEKVILQALEKFPNDRFPEAKYFRFALQDVRGSIRRVETEERPFKVRDPIDDLEDEVPAGAIELPPALREAMERRRKKNKAGDAEEGQAPPIPGGPAVPATAAAGPAASVGAIIGDVGGVGAQAKKGLQPKELAIIGVVTILVVVSVMAGLFMFSNP